MLKVGVLASGRGTNLQSIINEINKGRLPAVIKVVISDREGAGALIRAQEHSLSHYYLSPKEFGRREEWEKAILTILDDYEVELVLLAGFMRLLSPYFISFYQHRIMNIHPSLLPAFPGIDAQQQALEYGVKISGCTVHFVDEGMDTGPIILQQAVQVKEGDTVESLSRRILKKEHQIYPEAVRLYGEGRIKITGGKVIINDKQNLTR